MSLKKHIILVVGLLFSLSFYAQQITNQEVIAKIETESIDDIINIKGIAISNTEVFKSLRYVMYVIKTNPVNSNTSRGEHQGRFTLLPNEAKQLGFTGINKNTDDKVTVILLIYDDNDKLIGKDRRVALNDDEAEKKTIQLVDEKKENDGVKIIAIVTESTKTKPGRDFYNYFSSSYRLSQISGKGSIHILEKLSLGRNTTIDVLVDNKVVNSFFVRPNQEYLEQMTTITIQNIRRHFQNLEKQKNYITQY
ncbi:hypothetical protein D7030_13135 [Flavobacteriaceae bacterium AU392]|nr:hypothetical protein D1817_05355 [Flavobacteriaceae bacterium]RKM81248.1 hypothetical protein D7030_13135 [Flavobacteriaceae bacterium AU392]